MANNDDIESRPSAGEVPAVDEKAAEGDMASNTAEDAKLATAPGMHTDIAYDLYIESLAMDPERRAELAARVKRKLDMIVLPAVSLRADSVPGERASLTRSTRQMCWVYFLQFTE